MVLLDGLVLVVLDADGDTEITAQQGGVDTDVLDFITDGSRRMTISATDISMNTHVVLDGDASLNVGGTSLLNGVVDMESDLYVDGDVSLNTKLAVGGDVFQPRPPGIWRN